MILFLIFAGSAKPGADEPFINTLIGVMHDKAIIFVAVSAFIAAIGVFVQMRLTGFSQLLNAKATIRYQKRKPIGKLVKKKTRK